MAGRVVRNPIINSPYHPPARHFAFDDAGITDRVVDGRRPSSYFVPVPRSRSRGQQPGPGEPAADRIAGNEFVNQVRARVQRWRELDRPHVTPVTRRLLEYWTSPQRDDPVLFCQLEAAETAIYVAEAAQRAGDAWIGNELGRTNEQYNAGLNRVALKMATGSGKTVVMAMIIAWQALNKVADPAGKRFAKRFLVVTPGLTIRDRLRVLLPGYAENYYRLRDLVPADLYPDLSQAKIVITNYHTFQPRETRLGQGVAKAAKDLLAGRPGAPSPFLESWSQVAGRVCRDLGGASEIVVLNDEAHHCYSRRRTGPGAAARTALTADERAEAQANSTAARVWFTGLRAVAGKLGVKVVYDLSATPSFLSGSGYREGTLFPWVVSDFGLVEAIESGIVKIPRVPVDEGAAPADPAYLHLWPEVGPHLPRGGRRDGTVAPGELPAVLTGALRRLYRSYEKAFGRWEGSQAAARGEPPPVFIVVCGNTTVSKMVYDYIAGHPGHTGDGGAGVLVPGKLPLLSNVEDGRLRSRPRTILVDSQQLESGEGLSAEFRRIAAAEIGEFTAEYLRRSPGRPAGDLDDARLLREVMNTVGKRGKLGEPVRCVVSVSMLTEGWDAATVTHVLGVRAFGTQLLCEQVVGRGLRRRCYAADENGFFGPEYADVYGVPFQFVPAVATTTDLAARPVRRVHAQPGRAHAEIVFPRLTGYRAELPDGELRAEFTEHSRLVLTTAHVPARTVAAGPTAAPGPHTLDDLRRARGQQIAFELARRAIRYLSDGQDPRPWYFPQVLRITKKWLARCVSYQGGAFPGLLLLAGNAEQAARLIAGASAVPRPGSGTAAVLPMLRSPGPAGSTSEVDFFTAKEVCPTAGDRCHVNFAVLDGPRGAAAQERVVRILDDLPQVAAYVKNDHLGFTVPYAYQGRSRQYLPGFLVRLTPAGGQTRDLAHAQTLIVEVPGGRKPSGVAEEEARAVRELWLPAVNGHGGFGRWGYCELTDPARLRQDLNTAIGALRAGTGASAVTAP